MACGYPDRASPQHTTRNTAPRHATEAAGGRGGAAALLAAGGKLDGVELMRGALWSDPKPTPGRVANTRGAGLEFGPDVSDEFLTKNAPLSMVVRSHECVRCPALGERNRSGGDGQEATGTAAK